jgi:hypothetical protein
MAPPLTAARRIAHHGVVAGNASSARHRVFLPQALGADEFVRVTWHEAEQVVVFSQWRGSVCVAATPVRITETPELAALLVDALGAAARNPAHDRRSA